MKILSVALTAARALPARQSHYDSSTINKRVQTFGHKSAGNKHERQYPLGGKCFLAARSMHVLLSAFVSVGADFACFASVSCAVFCDKTRHVLNLAQNIANMVRMQPPIISVDLKQLIIELFFPDNCTTLDPGPSSSSPFVHELAQLFVHDESGSKQSLSQADVLNGFTTMAIAYARRTPSIQDVGNSMFRNDLRMIFRMAPTVTSSLDKGVLAKEIDVALYLTRLQDEYTDASPDSTPDDEDRPLLRSQTTTPATILDSMGKELLEWDHDTESLFDLIFSDLFGCITPGATSVSKRELEAIAEANEERSHAVQLILNKYAQLWVMQSGDCVTSQFVRLIFARLCTRLICTHQIISLPVNAYIRRKLRPVMHAIESKRQYVEGKQYKICIVVNKFGDRSVFRVTLLKRLDVRRFDVEFTYGGRTRQLVVSKLFDIDFRFSDDEDDSDYDDAPVKYVPRPILKHAFAHLDWSDEAYARDIQFSLRAIAADFPNFQLGEKVPKCLTDDYWVTFKKSSKLRMDFKNLDYGISFEPFCTAEFLPSLSPEDHKRLMDTAAMRESFRCFFLHLAVELGVHPVALQVIAVGMFATVVVFATSLSPILPPPLFQQHVCRERCATLSKLITDRTAADEDTEHQLFGESVSSVLERGCNRYLLLSSFS